MPVTLTPDNVTGARRIRRRSAPALSVANTPLITAAAFVNGHCINNWGHCDLLSFRLALSGGSGASPR